MGTADQSWELGPESVRLVRALIYLAEGIFGGVVLYFLVSTARTLLPDALRGEVWALGTAALFAILYARWLWFWKVFRRRSHPNQWVMEEWLEVQRWRWSMTLVAVIGGGLVAVSLRYPSWFLANENAVTYTGLGFALVFVLTAQALTSKGRIDPDSLTLSVLGYGGWRDIDLRTVTATRRVSFGRFTVLWLSLSPGVDKRVTKQGFYVVPTDVIERTWSSFEAGLAGEVPLDPATIERGRSLRRVNRFVAICFAAFALAVLVWLAWVAWTSRDPDAVRSVLIFSWLLAAGGLFFLKLAL